MLLVRVVFAFNPFVLFAFHRMLATSLRNGLFFSCWHKFLTMHICFCAFICLCSFVVRLKKLPLVTARSGFLCTQMVNEQRQGEQEGESEIRSLSFFSFQVLELFNLCILQGDSFLQSAGVYDDLYYELIRMHELFQSLHEYGERSSVFPLLFRAHLCTWILFIRPHVGAQLMCVVFFTHEWVKTGWFWTLGNAYEFALSCLCLETNTWNLHKFISHWHTSILIWWTWWTILFASANPDNHNVCFVIFRIYYLQAW